MDSQDNGQMESADGSTENHTTETRDRNKQEGIAEEKMGSNEGKEETKEQSFQARVQC